MEELDNLEAHYTNILKAKAEEKDGVLRTMKDVAFAENPMDREATGEDTKVSGGGGLIVICGIWLNIYTSFHILQVENIKGQFEIFNSLRENGFDNLVTNR